MVFQGYYDHIKISGILLYFSFINFQRQAVSYFSNAKPLGNSDASVNLPQAVLPAAYITLTLFSASSRPIFKFFCLDATGVLWCYSTERELDAIGALQR